MLLVREGGQFQRSLNTHWQEQNSQSRNSIRDIGCFFRSSADPHPHVSYVEKFMWTFKAGLPQNQVRRKKKKKAGIYATGTCSTTDHSGAGPNIWSMSKCGKGCVCVCETVIWLPAAFMWNLWVWATLPALIKQIARWSGWSDSALVTSSWSAFTVNCNPPPHLPTPSLHAATCRCFRRKMQVYCRGPCHGPAPCTPEHFNSFQVPKGSFFFFLLREPLFFYDIIAAVRNDNGCSCVDWRWRTNCEHHFLFYVYKTVFWHSISFYLTCEIITTISQGTLRVQKENRLPGQSSTRSTPSVLAIAVGKSVLLTGRNLERNQNIVKMSNENGKINTDTRPCVLYLEPSLHSAQLWLN